MTEFEKGTEDYAPGMSTPPVASSEPSAEAQDFVARILSGDKSAAEELEELARAAENGDQPEIV